MKRLARALSLIAVCTGLAALGDLPAAFAAKPGEEPRQQTPAELVTNTMMTMCSEFWTLKTIADVDKKQHAFEIELQSRAGSTKVQLDYDLREITGLRKQLELADKKALNGLASDAFDLYQKSLKAQKANGAKPPANAMPTADDAIAALENTPLGDAAESAAISIAMKPSRDIENRLIALTQQWHEDLAMQAALGNVRLKLKGCADDQRDYINKAHPQPETPGGTHDAIGVLLDRTPLAGNVAGVYAFDPAKCYGSGPTWTQKEGFLFTVDSNYAIDGKINFQGRWIALGGAVTHDGGFSAIASLPPANDMQPLQIGIAGHLARDASGKLRITKGTVLAGDGGATGSCEGTIL